MKKFLGALLLTTVLVPMSAFAQTSAGEVPVNATINEPNMYRMIGEVDHGGTQGNQGSNQASQTRCAVFVRPLRAGSRGDDVIELQKHLVSTGVLDMPEGVAYGYYGHMTAKAVSEYQVKSGIVAVGTGTVGPVTLQSFKKIFCSGSTPGNQGSPISQTMPAIPPKDPQCPPAGAKKGDANLDGVVDSKDYAAVNVGYYNHLTGWSNGDFDCNNRVDFDDYALIDQGYNTQAPQPSAKIDQSSLTSTSGTPTLTGSAYNVSQFGISMGGPSGDKVWGSGTIVVTNNRWSVKVTQAATNTGTLTPGTYKVLLYSNNTLIGTETLVIANTNGFQNPVN